MDDFNHALALSPNNAYIYYDRASLHIANGDTGKAIEDYTRAIQIEPHLAEAFFNRGLLYFKLGDKKSATKDLSKAGELGLYDSYSIIKKMN